jgi:hypothetical protein
VREKDECKKNRKKKLSFSTSQQDPRMSPRQLMIVVSIRVFIINSCMSERDKRRNPINRHIETKIVSSRCVIVSYEFVKA